MHIYEYQLEGMAHRRLQTSQYYRRKTECKTNFFETFDKSWKMLRFELMMCDLALHAKKILNGGWKEWSWNWIGGPNTFETIV